MISAFQVAAYLFIGLCGGLIGGRLRLPAGTLIGALTAVIAFKLIARVDWAIPKNYDFVLQVLLGVMVGATFHPAMLKTFKMIALPVLLSTVVLVLAGVLLSVCFNKLGILDIRTAYIGTSPGAMSVLVTLALDTHANASLVTCFHFFRIVFIIFTAPLILKIISG